MAGGQFKERLFEGVAPLMNKGKLLLGGDGNDSDKVAAFEDHVGRGLAGGIDNCVFAQPESESVFVDNPLGKSTPGVFHKIS